MQLYPSAAAIRPRSGGKPLLIRLLRLENRLLEIKIQRCLTACDRAQVPVKLSPKTLTENEDTAEKSKQGLEEARPQVCKVFSSGLECLPSDGRWVSSSASILFASSVSTVRVHQNCCQRHQPSTINHYLRGLYTFQHPKDRRFLLGRVTTMAFTLWSVGVGLLEPFTVKFIRLPPV